MYPYTQNTGNLTDLIKAIGKHGVPDKFTTRELPIWGYKSSNDRSIISVLKFTEFIDAAGTPSEIWRLARTAPEKATAVGVRTGYKTLFQTFPDAERRDSEALTNFFKAKTSVGDSVIKQMVATFKTLAQFGDFSDQTEMTPSDQVEDAINSPPQIIPKMKLQSSGGMTVNLNIELSLPSDETGKVYEAFFGAMKKHLLAHD
jgi:hypothetical protein